MEELREHKVNMILPQVCNVIPSQVHGNIEFMAPMTSRTCPLCKSEVRLFFINFNDKLLMCENTECEFPFGHEDLQFVKENNGNPADSEVTSISTRTMETPSGSYMTENTCSFTEKITKGEVRLEEMRAMDVQEYFKQKNLKKPVRKISANQKKVEKSLSEIKKLNESMSNQPKTIIKNEKWLKDLAQLQSSSKKQLVAPEELDLLKRTRTNVVKELTIDVKSEYGIPSITIDLAGSKETIG